MSARGVGNDGDLKDILPVSSLTNATTAAKIIADAMEAKKRIVVAGDYDVDGATGVTIALRGIRMMGSEADFVVPDRNVHGYGLSPSLVDVIIDKGCDLIITVDNGISSMEGVAHAKAAGIPVVVTDHHLAGDAVPDALCIVNPNQKGCTFESKSLCGAGVMFYVMMALRQELIARGKFTPITAPKLADLLDLVALATIADVVRLDRNNRLLTRSGLARIRAGKTIPMIKSLVTIAKRKLERLTSADLGFAIGPRLNAVGRMDDMTLGIRGLTTDDEKLAYEIALSLDTFNKERREVEDKMKEEAMSMIISDIPDADPAVILYNKDWHGGVIGILASRVKEDHNKPAIMFADVPGLDGLIRGSARSIPELNIRDALASVDQSLILKFGGHAMAAGMTLKKEMFEPFRAAFCFVVEEMMRGITKTNIIETDGSMPGSFTHDDVIAIEKEPWGVGYPQPLFDDEFDVVAQKLIGEGRHLKLMLRNESGVVVDAIMFFQEALLPPKIRAVYSPSLNEFRGDVNVQISLQHVESMVMTDTLSAAATTTEHQELTPK